MLMACATAETAGLAAEAIRVRTGAGLGTGLAADLPPMTVSAGVAQLREGESLSDLLRRADQASYQAKTGGRDRVCVAPGDHIVAEVSPAAFRRTG